ncbi:MAG: sigma-70 family RNA polymerase sigma factor [Thermoleophilaceae bacterium]
MERTGHVVSGARMPIRIPRRLLRLRSDDRLVEHVRVGDDAAFEVLYERYVAGILGFCQHMLGSREEAEDAVQHTFVSAHSAMQRSRRELTFKPWLYTIARNRCLSVLRARHEQPSDDIEPSTAGLQAEVEQRADVRELLADLRRLPEEQRAALVLTELGDLSHADVAAVIGCGTAAVKGIVFRARNALMERRDARAADCTDIREQLALATGGALRRSQLRYHLEGCPGCVAYLEEVRRQRKLLGVALPVVPTLALHDSVMASVGIGAGAATGVAAAGGAATAGAGSSALGLGSSAAGGMLAKIAIFGALAGGAGVATEAVVTHDRGGSSPPVVAPRDGDAGAAGRSDSGAAGGSTATGERGASRSGERSHGRRGAERRGRVAAGPTRGRAGTAPGKALGRDGNAPGRAVAPGGQAPASPSPAPPNASKPAPPAQIAPAAPPSSGRDLRAPAAATPPPRATPPAHGRQPR